MTLQAAGLVEVKTMKLSSLVSGNSADIRDVCAEFDIFEDMFSPAMTATATIMDTNNLILQFPIVGEEYVDIEYNTPDKISCKQRFYVYKIGERITNDDFKQLYVLHMISYDAITDLNTKFSRAFTGFTHNIAATIFTNYITTDPLYSGKIIATDSSTNEIKFVSPYWSPYKCLNYCASKSMGVEEWRAPGFLFFENNRNYNFTNTDILLDQAPVIKYIFDSDNLRNTTKQGGDERDVKRELVTVIDLKIQQQFDYIKRSLSGMYSHKTFEHDIVYKTLKTHLYSYQSDYSKSRHLGNNKVVSNNIVFADRAAVVDTKTNFHYAWNEEFKDNSAEIQNKRQSLLAQLDLYTVDITVHGRTDLKVGDVIDLTLGQFSALHTNEMKQTPKDIHYSGNHLVTAIRHRLTQTKHEMVVQLVKESLLRGI